jgi:co-chaperonin GroES (HSP10)
MADLTKRQEILATMAAIIFAASVGVELKTGDSTEIAVMKAKEILASIEKTK